MKQAGILAALAVLLFGTACGSNATNEEATPATPATTAGQERNGPVDFSEDHLVPIWSEYKTLVAVAG